jgi:hypothetical protein
MNTTSQRYPRLLCWLDIYSWVLRNITLTIVTHCFMIKLEDCMIIVAVQITRHS